MKLRTKLVIAFVAVMVLPSLFVVAVTSVFTMRRAEMIQQIYFLLVYLTSSVLVFWIYRTVSEPISRLQKAARSIKEGNLDFELHSDSLDEIGELFRDFEEMRIILKANAEEKLAYDKESKELISNISHDLKTPLTTIKGYVEGIMDGVADTPEKMDRYIKTIYNKANEMDMLINELTLYSKIDTNRIPYNFSAVEADSYFSDCADDLGIELEAKGFHFRFQNDLERPCRIVIDPEQLRRVINNIVSNSVKYMDKEEGEIGMYIADAGDRVRIDISDNGKGIAPKDLPYIFDRFYRAEISRNSSKGGRGIGLAIVKKIVEEHGGTIWAQSEEKKGTTISFTVRKFKEGEEDGQKHSDRRR